NRLKHYALSIFGLILILSASIFYLRSQNKRQEAEKNQLLSQLVKLKNAVPLPVPQVNKTDNAQTYIQNIQGKLQKINDYLRKRGLKGFSTKAVGGNGNDEASTLTDEQNY